MAEAKFDAARWTKNDRIVGVATFVLFISLFLTWFSVSASYLGVTYSATASGLSAHGYLYIDLILCLVILAYLVMRALFEEMPFKLPFPEETLLFVATAINFLLVLVGFLAKPGGSGVGWSYGAFIALIAAIVAVVPYVMPFVKKLQGSKSA
jgi:branched-subunit amino acid transport protein